jgi:ABC-2 type transport system permease protein
VVADGDIILNQFNLVNPNIPKGAPLPLGYDQYTNTQYGNKDFLVNTLDYMLDDKGLIAIRSRELKIRLLDLEQIKEERLYWQLLNTLVPLLLLILMALANTWWRRKKYVKS